MASHLLVLLLSLFVFLLCLANISAETGRKELRNKEAEETIIQNEHPIQRGRVDPSQVIQLSWRPRVFLYEGFLSDEECDLLISMAKGMKEKSTGEYGIDSGKVKASKLPNHLEISSTLHNSIEAIVEERISAWTFLPEENSEPLQVHSFEDEDFKGKYDYFGNKSISRNSDPVIATVVLFLSDVSRGGQILFPESELGNSRLKNMMWSDCGKSSKLLKPRKGNAILFFNSHLNASPDRSSPHSRCPVLEGELWCATKIFHTSSVKKEKAKAVELQLKDSDCEDEDENCPRWASMGECDKNPVFMIGSPDYYGTCRKSCNACQL